MYVTNILEMSFHIAHHRKRVLTLGMDIHKEKDLTRLLYYTVFKLHDIEKYLFLPWLWKYYGKKGDKVKAKQLYIRMNKVGAVIIKAALFFFFFFKQQEKNKVKHYEHIIDVIDRHCDPVAMEEFDLVEQRPLTNFISVRDLPMAISFKKKWLEKFDDLHEFDH